MTRLLLSPAVRRFSMLLALAAAALLAGRASSPLTSEQRSAFQRVSIAKVEMPDKPTIASDLVVDDVLSKM